MLHVLHLLLADLGKGRGGLGGSEVSTHLLDGLSVGFLGAGSLEDRAASHEHVHACLGDLRDVVHCHAPVDLCRKENKGKFEN